MALLTLLALLLGFVSGAPVGAATFDPVAEVVSNSVRGNQLTWLASAVDSGGNAYVAWRSGTGDATLSNRKIRVAKRTSGTWAIVAELGADQVASANTGMGSTGNLIDWDLSGTYFTGLSLAVDPAGAIHIAFHFQNNSDSCCTGTSQRRGLGYAKYSGGSWTTIEPLQIYQTSNGFQDNGNPVLRVTSAGVPRVAFNFGDAGPHAETVRYGTRASGAWAFTDLDTYSTSNSHPVAPAMAIDSSDKVHIVNNQAGDSNSDLVERNDTSGSLSSPAVVVTGGFSSAPQYPSVVSSGGHLYVAYWDNTSSLYKFTSNVGGSFSAPTVIDSTAVAFAATTNTADSLGVGGNVSLFVYTDASGNVKAANRTGTSGAWTLDTVDTGGKNFSVGTVSSAGQMTVAYEKVSGVAHAVFVTQTTGPPSTTVSSINRAAASPTNASSVSWTVTFATSVTGVTSNNFTLVNNGLGGTPQITGVSGGGTSWTVTASTGTGSGTLGLNMANDTGLSLTVSNLPFTGQVYTIDRTAPTISSINRANSDPTNASSVSWTVTFSKSVTGVGSGNFTLVPGGGLGGTPAISTPTGSGTTWTVTASTGSGSGTLQLNATSAAGITDSVGNALTGLPVSGQTYTIDRTAPTVSSINRAAASPTNATSVSWTVTFSKSVTGVTSGNFGLVNNGLGGTPTLSNPTGSGTTWTVTASTGTGAGTLELDLTSVAGITDPAGNTLSATTPVQGEVYSIDRVAPTVSSINRNDPDPTAATSVSWTVTFSKSVTGVGSGNFTLVPGGGLGGTPAISTPTGSGTTWTVTASTGSGTGTLALRMANSTGVADSVGNAVSGLPFTGQAYSVDRAPSAIAASAGTPQSAIVNTAFATALKATVTNAGSQPIPGLSVTFTVNPVSGAGASFGGSATVTTDASGVATAPTLTANATPGSYTVTATVGGVATPATFNLSNTPGTPATIAVTGLANPIASGTSGSVILTVKDSIGNTVTGYTGTIHFTSNDPQAVLPGDYQFTTGSGNDNGVHTFTGVTLKVAGNRTVTATDTTASPALTGALSVYVTPTSPGGGGGGGGTLVVADYLTPTAAGAARTFIVTAKDGNGNTAIDYAGTVHFTSTDAAATLPNDYTFTATDQGAHTFTATFRTAGTVSITATDSANSLTGAQTGIVVQPGPATHFALTGGASSASGADYQVTVTAKDAAENTVTTYPGTVRIESSDSRARLAGNHTYTGGDGGVFIFTITLNTAGNQTVTATDIANGGITGSKGVNVNGPSIVSTGAATSGISPSSGPQAGGTTIAIVGANLTGASVSVGGVACTNVTVNGAGTSLTCVTGAHAPATVDVVVTTSGGSATAPGGFTYLPAGGVSPAPSGRGGSGSGGSGGSPLPAPTSR